MNFLTLLQASFSPVYLTQFQPFTYPIFPLIIFFITLFSLLPAPFSSYLLTYFSHHLPLYSLFSLFPHFPPSIPFPFRMFVILSKLYWALLIFIIMFTQTHRARTYIKTYSLCTSSGNQKTTWHYCRRPSFFNISIWDLQTVRNLFLKQLYSYLTAIYPRLVVNYEFSYFSL